MKVGFIGLGSQGKGLALNLVRAGHDLIVYDIRCEPLDELASAGARIAASPREVGEHAEVIEVCVLNDAQVEAVVLAPDGVLATTARGAVIAIHSTIDPATVAKLADAAAPRGIEIVDAPVSGGARGAETRTVSYMVGGSDAAIEKCLPLFQTSGKNITRTGALGTGMKAKLAHQVIVCINMLAAYEGMRLGVEAGLAPDVLRKIVHDGAAQSRVADHWFEMSMGPAIAAVLRKDLELCLKFARQLGRDLPGAALTHELIEKIVP
jgi:3-hydroxyisobutyrate dehydrogenase-like beta-hydroxyacid dehydrogenase